MLLSSFAANSPEAGKQQDTLAKISVTSLTFKLTIKPVFKSAFTWVFQLMSALWVRVLIHLFWISLSSQFFNPTFWIKLAIKPVFKPALQVGLLVIPSSQSFELAFWVGFLSRLFESAFWVGLLFQTFDFALCVKLDRSSWPSSQVFSNQHFKAAFRVCLLSQASNQAGLLKST